MAHVLVIAGGSSNEREVSLRSGAAVKQALQTGGHTVTMYDPADSKLSLAVAAQKQEIAFPALHGAGGEDGVIQRSLEHLQLAYVGSGVAASELCFDKWNFRTLLQSHDLPLAQGQIVDRQTLPASEIIKTPFVLKPARGGSSIDTILVHDPSQYPSSRIADVFSRHVELLLEQLIDGVEITVAVVNDAALPVIEIIPPAGGEFDYTNKYNGQSQELCPPQHVSPIVQLTAQNMALTIHKLCGCRDLSRTDMIVRPNGDIVVLETNTIPGLTDQSLLPKAAAVSGKTMPQLCDQLVQAALGRPTGRA